MNGFFTNKETASPSRLKGRAMTCVQCGAYLNVTNPKMPAYGNFKKGIMIIGETYSRLDDERGMPWQDKNGRILRHALRKQGIDLFEDCLSVMACRCCLTTSDDEEYRHPKQSEIDSCRKSILKIIDDNSPQMVILLGTAAVKSVLGHRWKKDIRNIDTWRGWVIPDQELKAWVCPTFNPAFVQDKHGVKELIWNQDLEKFLSYLDKPIPRVKKPTIETITDLSVLNSIRTDMTAFDYETTGLKPHAEGHRIVSCSVADNADHVYVFLIPRTRIEQKPFLEYLSNFSIGKIASNMKYEDVWSKVRLKTRVNGWLWDTMLAAHVLDNRPYITGLKFQTYVNFGIIDYASEIEPYLNSDSKNGNALNNIMKLIETKAGMEKLLTYNALDSIYEYRLAEIQIKQMNYSFLPF